MVGSETALLAVEVTAPAEPSCAPGHIPVRVARAVTAIRWATIIGVALIHRTGSALVGLGCAKGPSGNKGIEEVAAITIAVPIFTARGTTRSDQATVQIQRLIPDNLLVPGRKGVE